MTTQKAQRGRPATFENNKAVVAALKDVQADENAVSRFLKLQLLEKGFLQAQNVQTGKRGRPQVKYTLSGKGRGLVALSKNWK